MVEASIITERVNLSEQRVYPAGLNATDHGSPTDYPAAAHNIIVSFHNETASGGYNPDADAQHTHTEGLQSLTSIPTSNAPKKVVIDLQWGIKKATLSLPLLSADIAATYPSYTFRPENHSYTFTGPGDIPATATRYGDGIIEYTGDRFTSSDLGTSVSVKINITKP